MKNAREGGAPAQLPEVYVDGQSGAGSEKSTKVSIADPALEVHLQQALLTAHKAQSAIYVDLVSSNYVHETVFFCLNCCRGTVAFDVHSAGQTGA